MSFRAANMAPAGSPCNAGRIEASSSYWLEGHPRPGALIALLAMPGRVKQIRGT